MQLVFLSLVLFIYFLNITQLLVRGADASGEHFVIRGHWSPAPQLLDVWNWEQCSWVAVCFLIIFFYVCGKPVDASQLLSFYSSLRSHCCPQGAWFSTQVHLVWQGFIPSRRKVIGTFTPHTPIYKSQAFPRQSFSASLTKIFFWGGGEVKNNINKSDDDNAKPNKSNGGDYDQDYYSVGNGGHYLYCSLIAYNALRAWLNPDCSSATFSCSLLRIIAYCLFPVLHKKQVIKMSGTITLTPACSLRVSEQNPATSGGAVNTDLCLARVCALVPRL